MIGLPGWVHVCSWARLRKMRTVKPKVVIVYTQVKSVRSSVSLLVRLIFFFSWHVQPLFLGVESLFVFEEQEKRRAGGYLTQLRSEHLFQLLFLGCKCLCSHFFFSLKFSFSSLCVSNTVLASCNKIDLGQRKNPWRCGAVISGASGDGCSGADVVRARPPPTTAPHHWWFW